MNLVEATHQLATEFPPGSIVSLDKTACDKGLRGRVVGYRIVHFTDKSPEMRLSVDVPGDHWVLSPHEVVRITE